MRLKSIQAFFCQKHFKLSVGAATLALGVGAAFAFTPFSLSYVLLMTALAFTPAYLVASRFRDKLDNSDIWKGILAAEKAREAPPPSFDEEEKVAELWRQAYRSDPAPSLLHTLKTQPSVPTTSTSATLGTHRKAKLRRQC